MLNEEQLSDFKIELVGELLGFEVWIVNGEAVRDDVDVDFTTGGNPERYAYVPADEIWIDDSMHPTELAACVVHEVVETLFMRDGGLEYEDAHDQANERERRLRRLIELGLGVSDHRTGLELATDFLEDLA